MEITDKNYDELIGGGLVLVDFMAGWCVPCSYMKPVIHEIDEAHPELTVYEYDTEKFQENMMKLGIQSIPTVILYKDGVEVTRLKGFPGGPKTKEKLVPYLEVGKEN